MCDCFKGIKDAVRKGYMDYSCKHCKSDITLAYFLALEAQGTTPKKDVKK